MGDRSITVLGHSLTSVPILQLSKAALYLVLIAVIFLLRKRLESPRPDVAEAEASAQ